jgi:2-iminoacetate synthase ThiH
MIEQLMHRIKIRQAEIRTALAEGQATTWESYQRLVGENYGLQSSIEFIEGILEDQENKE